MKETPIRVLYIEDDPADVELAKAALEHTCVDVKYELDVTEDPDDVINACDRFKPDIILLDFHLPKKSGLELLEILRNSLHKEVPVLLLSGSFAPKLKEEAAAKGADACFIKPFDFQSFKEIFRRICNDWFRPLADAKNFA
jgi:CheY-like chemotaxis protein